MTAIDFTAGQLRGVRVTSHSETPGVGTRVADPSYLRTYAGRSLGETVFSLQPAGGDILGVSGATRTSTAVADGVRQAVEFITAHHSDIPGWVANHR